LFIPCIIVQSSLFQQTNAHNCNLIYNNNIKNIELLRVSDLSGPSSRSILNVIARHFISLHVGTPPLLLHMQQIRILLLVTTQHQLILLPDGLPVL